MARVKNSVVTRARRKKILKRAKGFFGSKHRLWKTAKEQLMNSGFYAFRDRRAKKRDFRKLWIQRINAAVRMYDMSYSKFMSGLKKAGVDINRKMLSEIAIMDEKAFKALVETSKKGLTEKVVKAEVKVEKEVKEVKASSDLESKTLKELKELAKEKNVEGYSTMKKAELLEALK
jgi:ribosomal protein L20